MSSTASVSNVDDHSTTHPGALGFTAGYEQLLTFTRASACEGAAPAPAP